MSDEWRITEHTPNGAAQFADRWATAVAAQARRIHRPENTFERVPDTFLQIIALRQLTRAAEMAKEAAEPEAARLRIQEAIDAFLDAIVVEMNMADKAQAFKLARDVLEHFDEYYQGSGREQRKTARDDPGLCREDLAQRYRVELAGPSADRPHLRVGSPRPAEPLVVIDLVERAPGAARNAVDASMAQIIRRPAVAGHLGEWVASRVFDIELEESASAAGIDGRFRSEPVQGRTVNVKWYMKHEGLLDMTEFPALDYYLVLTGPPSSAASSRGGTRSLVHPVGVSVRRPAASR